MMQDVGILLICVYFGVTFFGCFNHVFFFNSFFAINDVHYISQTLKFMSTFVHSSSPAAPCFGHSVILISHTECLYLETRVLKLKTCIC